MTKNLKVGAGLHPFTLPLSTVTSTQAIIARKRSGKSYAFDVLAEEMQKHGQQVGIIDPTGAHYGLKSSASGKKPGYAFVVFGGDHADAPLDWRAGREMALAFIQHGFSAIWDISNFDTEEQIQFVNDFAREMLKSNREAVHIGIDEADTYAPQMLESKLQKVCLGSVRRLVKQGGVHGVGVSLITQRSADLSKSVLSQVDRLVALTVSHPADIVPIVDWVAANMGQDAATTIKEELSKLKRGEAFFCAEEKMTRVQVRAKETFDSGATPKAGERKIIPKVLAHVDIQLLGQKIADSVKKAKEESPEYLKRRIAELEAAAKKTTLPAINVASGITPERERMLLEQIAGLQKTAGAYDKAMTAIYRKAGDLVSTATELQGLIASVRTDNPAPAATPAKVAPQVRPQALPSPAKTVAARVPANVGDTALPLPERKLLASLAWFHAIGVDDPEAPAVAFMAGYTHNSSSFKNPRGKLASMGLITVSSGRVSLTEAGAAVAEPADVPQGNEGLQGAVLAKLPLPEQKLLTPLLKVYPKGMSSGDLAEAAGYSVGSSSFKNPRGRLGSLGLIRIENGEVYAKPLLFPGGA